MPPQHGAWAFLALPVAVAVTVSPWTPLLLLLAVAWVCAYPASYFVLAVVRDRASRHPDTARFARPLAIWWIPALAAGIPLLIVRPWLIWVAMGYSVLFAVNIAFARRRDERALVNDAVFVLECAAMVPVTWAVAAGGSTLAAPPLSSVPVHAWVLTAAVALLLSGSTLHVKSLIRERADPRFARASRSFAWASLVAAVGLAVWWGLPAGLLLIVPFAWFVLRSMLLADPASRPARIGMVELVGFVLLVLAAAVATAASGPS
ncbi:MAG: YwiC-like family protein [Alsobacter sp.]